MLAVSVPSLIADPKKSAFRPQYHKTIAKVFGLVCQKALNIRLLGGLIATGEQQYKQTAADRPSSRSGHARGAGRSPL